MTEEDFGLREVCGLRRHTTTPVSSQSNSSGSGLPCPGREKQNRGGLDISSAETRDCAPLQITFSLSNRKHTHPSDRSTPASSRSRLCVSFRPQHSSSFFLTCSERPITALRFQGGTDDEKEWIVADWSLDWTTERFGSLNEGHYLVLGR